MASLQTTSLLARARPGRVPTSRSLVTPAAAPTPSSNVSAGGPTNGPGATGNAALAAAALGSSNISIFLTNLRILDLDLLPDWPDINPLTFTNKDAAQGQKKRIQSVEWALYQLFDLWDEEETRQKLQPFFPPLDHVQSLNLRAALLRCLENAKKTGVLGRDAVVRKTMLDECKGERLEEVLAVFSSAVLKKLVAEVQLNDRTAGRPALAQTLALEPRGYSGDNSQIATLVLAHRASLSRLLRQKNEARRRYGDLAQLLDLKEKGIARRTAQLEARGALSSLSAGAGAMSEDEKLTLWREVRNNWSGNERWMETLLYGDAPKDNLLTAPFDRVWRRTCSGRLSELDDDRSYDTGGQLLAQLETRVHVQKERLKKWQDFRRNMFGTDTARQDREQKRKSLGPAAVGAVATGKPRGIDLGFVAHESLRLGGLSPRKLPVMAQALKPEYATLVDSLERELEMINSGDGNPFTTGLLPRASADGLGRSTESLQVDGGQEAFSELSDPEEESTGPRSGAQLGKWGSDLAQEPEEPPVQRSQPVAQPIRRTNSMRHPAREGSTDGLGVRPQSLVLDQNTRLPSAACGSRIARHGSDSSTNHPRQNSAAKEPVRERQPQQQTRLAPRTPSPPRLPANGGVHRWRQPSPEPAAEKALPQQQAAVSHTQKLADEILDSMDNASPSPEKKPRHTLSLAERTRLSMVRGPQLAALADADENDIARLPLRRADTRKREDDAAKEVAEGEVDDLVARTRRSMANFEATRQKAQLERRRSQRKAARESSAGYPAQQHRRNGGGGSLAAIPPTTEETGGHGEGESMLVDEMIQKGLDDDYATVFMSRPKIKTSPAASPTRHWDE